MMLVISVLLALVPLLGIAWIVLYGSITTVDGLFMSLILAAMSGIVGLNILIELRKRGTGKQSSATATSTAAGGLRQRGKVQSVQFYESGVGQPNKSVVTLSDGGARRTCWCSRATCETPCPSARKFKSLSARKADTTCWWMSITPESVWLVPTPITKVIPEKSFPAPCPAQLRYKF